MGRSQRIGGQVIAKEKKWPDDFRFSLVAACDVECKKPSVNPSGYRDEKWKRQAITLLLESDFGWKTGGRSGKPEPQRNCALDWIGLRSLTTLDLQ